MVPLLQQHFCSDGLTGILRRANKREQVSLQRCYLGSGKGVEGNRHLGEGRGVWHPLGELLAELQSLLSKGTMVTESSHNVALYLAHLEIHHLPA